MEKLIPGFTILTVAYLLYSRWPRPTERKAKSASEGDIVEKLKGVKRPTQYQRLPLIDTRRDGLEIISPDVFEK